MRIAFWCLVIALVVVWVGVEDASARGGRGGGGGGGGRGGGGGGGRAMAGRPSGGNMRAPSRGGYGGGFPSSRMQAPPSRNFRSSAAPRPGGGNRPNVASRPSQRPSTRPGGVNRPNLGTGAAQRPSTLPGGGNRPSFGSGTGQRPSTLPGQRPGNVGGPQLGFTPGGNRPTGIQLNDFLGLPGHVNSPATLPARTPGMGLANRPNLPNLPGAADRPGLANRPGLADRPGLANRPGLTDRPTTLPANRYDNIRDRWESRPDRPFDRDNWHNLENAGWWYNSWASYPYYWAWSPSTYDAVDNWLPGQWSEPITYDYGTTIVYQDDNVYDGQTLLASQEEYAEQANTIAQSVPEDIQEEKVEWLPLGVFAISEEKASNTSMIMQLAVSKEGMIAGTYHHESSGNSRPIQGMIDKETQRAAWKFSDEKQQDVVFETGVSNLTQDESKCLVHFGPDKTQTWIMVRLPAPQEPADAEPKGIDGESKSG